MNWSLSFALVYSRDREKNGVTLVSTGCARSGKDLSLVGIL